MVYSLGIAVGIVGKCQDVIAYGHLGKLAAVVDIVVGGGAIGSAGTHAVGVVGVAPGGAISGHGGKLPTMLPGVGPGAIIEGVTDLVVGNGIPVIGGEQVAPAVFQNFLAVGVVNGVQYSTQRFRCIAVFLAVLNITGIVVCPGIGLVPAGYSPG